MQERLPETITQAARQLPAMRAAAKRLGLPLTEAALRRNPSVPAAQNAAPLYRQAIAALAKIPSSPKSTELSLLSDYLKPGRTAAQQKAVANALPRYREVIRLAEAAAAKPHCDFNRAYNGFSTPFPEFAQMRNFARLLCAQALVQSAKNDPMGALVSVKAALMIARHAGEETLLLPSLVSIAIHAITDAVFRQILLQHGTKNEVLARAAEVHRATVGMFNVRYALRGEVAGISTAIEQTRRGAPLSQLGMTDVDNDPVFLQLQKLVQNPATRTVLCDAWMARNLEFWSGCFTAMNRPGATLRTQHSALKKFAAEHERPFSGRSRDYSYLLNAILAPVYPQGGVKFMQAEATARVRGTAIELLRQRNATGRFPDRLPQNASTIDPFTDTPLKYRRVGNGFVVYSVSFNGTDEQGSEERDAKRFPKDIAFRYP